MAQKINRIILDLKWVHSNSRKWKLPRNIGFTYQRLGEAFQHRCAVPWWKRGRILTFQVDLMCFYYCSSFYYISCVCLCCYPTFVSRFCLPELWRIKSTPFFKLILPWQLLRTVRFYWSWSNYISCPLIIWIRIVLASNKYWVNEYFV